MAIGSIKRWQWIVISILIGLLIGYVRNGMTEDPIGDFRHHLTLPEFESEIVTKYTVAGGQQKFKLHGLSVELLPDTRDTAKKQTSDVSREGKYATLILPGHGYTDGQKVRISGSQYSHYNGEFTVSNATPNGFRIEVGEKAPNKPGMLTVTAPQRMVYVVKGYLRSFQPMKEVKKNDRVVQKFVKDGKTATVTLANHGYTVGQRITLYWPKESKNRQYNSDNYVVREVTADTFKVNVPAEMPDQPDGELRTCLLTQAYELIPSSMVLNYGPYKPVLKTPSPTVTYRPSTMQRLFEKLGIKQPDAKDSILDYLATMQSATGNTFQYHWWTQPKVRIAVWTLGSFVCFGLIFPTLVNIMVFGTPLRPKEEKGQSLRGVKTSTEKAKGPASKVTQEDMDQLKALEAELEKKLAGNTVTDARPAPPADFDDVSLEKAPPKLSDKAAEPIIAVPQTQEQHEYARRTGDFYPVERPKQARDKEKPDTKPTGD